MATSRYRRRPRIMPLITWLYSQVRRSGRTRSSRSSALGGWACMLWHYAKGKPRDEVQSDQHLVITWRSWRDEAGDGTAVEHQTRRPIALPARDSG
jgi:hypothetical protein